MIEWEELGTVPLQPIFELRYGGGHGSRCSMARVSPSTTMARPRVDCCRTAFLLSYLMVDFVLSPLMPTCLVKGLQDGSKVVN